jgi:hypothetical protein
MCSLIVIIALLLLLAAAFSGGVVLYKSWPNSLGSHPKTFPCPDCGAPLPRFAEACAQCGARLR